MLTVKQYIIEVLESIKLFNGIKSVDFDIGLNRNGFVDDTSTNRVKFTVKITGEVKKQ